jgi:Tfp pilus assembly protein PilF
VGRELGVGAVLAGRVVQREDTLNVHAELVDVQSGSQLWGQQYNRELADIVSVQNDIAAEIAQALRLQLTGEEQQQLAKSETTSSEAYRSYLKGRYFWNKRTNEDFKKAIEFFEEAKARDPAFALAHVGLADCYSLLGMQIYGADEAFPPKEATAKARSAALEALRLDDTLAEARTTLAWIRFLYDWDWEGAEKDFQQAIALDPDYETSHQWYSVYLAVMDRHEEAIEEAKRALTLAPTSPLLNRNLGGAFMRARQYGDAIDQMKKTLELDASFPLAREWLIDTYWLNGMGKQAVAEAKRLDERVGRFYELVKEGKQTEASQLVPSLPGHDSLQNIVRSHTLAGDEERLLEHLEEAFQERHPQLLIAMTSPLLDPLRSDPRFQDLRRRMGLEP